MRRLTIAMGTLSFLSGTAFGMHESRSFINADDAHAQGITGYGVTVAVVDTGIDYSHPGLSERGVRAHLDISVDDGVQVV